MIRLSLRARLTIWFGASLLLILAPVMASLAVLEWRQMRHALDHHLEQDLEFAAEMLVARAGGVQWRTGASSDPGYDAGSQRWVEVYTPQGDPLYFRGLPARPEIRAALPAPTAGPPGFLTAKTPAGAYTRLFTGERRVDDVPVLLRVARSEDQLRGDLRTLVVLFALAGPIAILGAALAGYVISGRALAPLSRMAERAHTISAERLSERLPVENPADELGQLATVFNDTFARLEGSFERLKRFTADASHQLRTPLTAIRSVGEVGLRQSKEPGEYQEVIGSMLEEADRLAALVDALLTLSRWESGRVQRAPAPLDLGDIARRVAAQLSVLAEERGITVVVQASTPALVSADEVMLRSAVMNVVDNAIKFTPDGRTVRIRTRPGADRHHLVVDDEGPGVPESQREQVLDRFHRVETTTGHATARPGAGLGLAIANWAVRANEGSLVIEANEAGGARVVITLPRAQGSSAAPAVT